MAGIDDEVEVFLAENPEFYVNDFGKVTCKLTGHEMKPYMKEINSYITGKKYATAKKRADFDVSKYGPWVVEDRTDNTKMFCNITKKQFPKDSVVLDKHVNGRRFKLLAEQKSQQKEEFARIKEKRAAKREARRLYEEQHPDAMDEETTNFDDDLEELDEAFADDFDDDDGMGGVDDQNEEDEDEEEEEQAPKKGKSFVKASEINKKRAKPSEESKPEPKSKKPKQEAPPAKKQAKPVEETKPAPKTAAAKKPVAAKAPVVEETKPGPKAAAAKKPVAAKKQETPVVAEAAKPAPKAKQQAKVAEVPKTKSIKVEAPLVQGDPLPPKKTASAPVKKPKFLKKR